MTREPCGFSKRPPLSLQRLCSSRLIHRLSRESDCIAIATAPCDDVNPAQLILRQDVWELQYTPSFGSAREDASVLKFTPLYGALVTAY